MSSYEFNIGAKARAGTRFLSDVRDEIHRAFSVEKGKRKITQLMIAERLGVNRSVVNRQIMGLENLTVKSIGELLWAIGWEPHFEARELDEFGANHMPHLSAVDAARRLSQEVQSTSAQTSDSVLRLLRGASANTALSQHLRRSDIAAEGRGPSANTALSQQLSKQP